MENSPTKRQAVVHSSEVRCPQLGLRIHHSLVVREINLQSIENIYAFVIANMGENTSPIYRCLVLQMGREDFLLREWLDLSRLNARPARFRVARMRLPRQHSLVCQMLSEWLEHYRSQARVYSSPVPMVASTLTPYSLQHLQQQLHHHQALQQHCMASPPLFSGASAAPTEAAGLRCPSRSPPPSGSPPEPGLGPPLAPSAQPERPASSASSGSEKGAKLPQR